MNDLDYIKDELNQTVESLTITGKRLKVSAPDAVNKRANYESKKNGYLLQLKAEENADPSIKRTDSIRQAMYRSKYEKERLAWLLAESDYETDVLLFKGLQSKLNALQTVARLSETEYKSGLNLDDKIMTMERQISLIMEAIDLRV